MSFYELLPVASELLVIAKYKDATGYRRHKQDYFLVNGDTWVDGEAKVQPFSATDEGDRQEEALIDWLNEFRPRLWRDSKYCVENDSNVRLTWCLKHLGSVNRREGVVEHRGLR